MASDTAFLSYVHHVQLHAVRKILGLNEEEPLPDYSISIEEGQCYIVFPDLNKLHVSPDDSWGNLLIRYRMAFIMTLLCAFVSSKVKRAMLL